MTEQQRHKGAEHVVEGTIPHPPTAGAPALERDPEADVRQFARSLALGAVRACAHEPLRAADPHKRRQPP